MTALALLLVSLAAGQPDACVSRYQDSYLADWGVSAESWRASCANGLKPDDILRPAQRRSIDACAVTYAKLEDSGKAPRGTVNSFCAQGEAGRAHLEELAGGRKAAPAAASKAEAALLRPAKRNMGPAAMALGRARRDFMKDACWAGLYYSQVQSDLTSKSDFELLERDPVHFRITPRKAIVEQYTYYFTSPSAHSGLYRVSTGDSLMPLACYSDDDSKIEPGWALDVPGFNTCLGPVKIDLQTAVAIASGEGVRSNADLKAFLGNFPEGYFAGEHCQVSVGEKKTVPCAAAGWDLGALRRATGKEVWVVTAGKTAVVDAARGRVYFAGHGELAPNGLAQPYSVGVSCTYTPMR